MSNGQVVVSDTSVGYNRKKEARHMSKNPKREKVKPTYRPDAYHRARKALAAL